ncbi:RNA polymerase II transcriptional coactivator KIWI-like [Heracleum sosnowskyi]|uniref:RNA polymerase II transcriptional coactivator KIWI-like n=1 Tax=Heracleum sosnowskyi TaxID=360622 RepID=A0AAD8MX34_9APIA|nr:RNA polymerase II transcriptional coactivator KIWI-like [Heracleum sosnowskyi]
MWKRRKSNADGDAPAKKYQKKSSANQSNANDSESIVVCEVANNKRVSVRIFNGNVMVDIRETYENSAGEKCPGKKGIALTLDQWNILREHVDEIDKVVADHK